MPWNGIRDFSDFVFLDLAFCQCNPDPFALHGWEAEDDPGDARSGQVSGSAKTNPRPFSSGPRKV